MSRKTFFVPLSVALAGATVAFGADPVFTDPVGYVKLGNTTGETEAVPTDTDVLLTIPLESTLAFSGTIASWDKGANTITVNGSPTWGADDWVPETGAPYCAIVSSGTENGLRGLITSNSGDTVTITLTTPGDLDQLTVGDELEIRNCWTLSTFFENSNVYDFCEVLFYNEAQTGTNHSASKIYTYYQGVWYLDLSEPSNDSVIHPGEMFILRSTGSVIPNLTVFGDVATSKHRISLMKDGPGQEDMEIGLFSAVPEKIGAINLPASNFDEVHIYNNFASGENKSSSQILTFYEGLWYLDLSEDVTTTFDINPGQGFKLRRNADAPANEEVDWQN